MQSDELAERVSDEEEKESNSELTEPPEVETQSAPSCKRASHPSLNLWQILYKLPTAGITVMALPRASLKDGKPLRI